jgi:hypothetical protein
MFFALFLCSCLQPNNSVIQKPAINKYEWMNNSIVVAFSDNLSDCQIQEVKKSIAYWNSKELGKYLISYTNISEEHLWMQGIVSANVITVRNGLTQNPNALADTRWTFYKFYPETLYSSEVTLKNDCNVKVILHEIGHALSGHKHSSYPNSIMYEEQKEQFDPYKI